MNIITNTSSFQGSKKLLFFIVCCLTIFIYTQGLPGDFVFDDMTNIKNNELLKVDELDINLLREASFSSESGMFKRPVSMFTFAINHIVTGMDPVAMKVTNVVIHLINGYLIYLFITLVLLSLKSSVKGWASREEKLLNWLPVTVASLWLVHPYNLTSVLYVVQRMTSLSTLFTLAALVCWLYGRLIVKKNNVALGYIFFVLTFAVFTPLAILSKESGFLIIPHIILIELIIFKSYLKLVKINEALLITSFIVSITIALFFISQLDYFQSGYLRRDFSLDERVLTEFRILGSYIREIVQPDITRMSLSHDDVVISESWFQPITTLWSMLLILVGLFISIISIKKNPLLSYSLLFFMTCHLMESTVISLELVYEHRNYLASVGILMLLSILILDLSEKIQVFAPVLISVIFIYFSVSTLFRAIQWSSLENLYMSDLKHKPQSPRANHNAAELISATIRNDKTLLENNFPQARMLYLRSNELSKNYTAGLIGLILSSSEFKQKVDHSWLHVYKSKILNDGVDHHRAREFNSLVECHIQKICALDGEVEELISIMQGDERLKGKKRAKVLWVAANYYFHNFQDKKSYKLLLEAAKYDERNASYLIAAAKVAAGAKKYKLVRQQLDKVGKLKLHSKQVEQVNKLEGLLVN